MNVLVSYMDELLWFNTTVAVAQLMVLICLYIVYFFSTYYSCCNGLNCVCGVENSCI
jgi:hypothetical protein